MNHNCELKTRKIRESKGHSSMKLCNRGNKDGWKRKGGREGPKKTGMEGSFAKDL